jgi:elongation factor G
VVGTAEAEGKVKKQTGGHGQYAVVNLRVAPLARGEGFVFKDSIVGGAIPRNYIPAVHKGLEECVAQGGVHGFPVVDVSVECYDGKYHAVDSSEMAFKSAAAQGLKDAMVAAGVAVLEPVSLLTVAVPSSSQGDVMGDVTARRGRVQGTTTRSDGYQEITALVPTSEIMRYAIDLRSMTGGRGSFSAVHDHYDVLPSHLLDRTRPSGR